MAAPAVADVKAFLVNRCGLDADSPLATDDTTIGKALAFALRQLLKRTGYDPYIYGAASDMEVEIVGKAGRFPNGANGDVTVSLDGTEYVAGNDYRLYPLNKDRKESILWLRSYRPTKPLTVNAQWGYADDYPGDIWEAIVMLAVAVCLVAYATGQAAEGGGSWTDGDVSSKLAVEMSSNNKGLGSIAPGLLATEAYAVFAQDARMVTWG